MGDRIESLEDKIISVATENKKEAESKAEPQERQTICMNLPRQQR